jgi:ribose transport system permease protein
MSLDGRINMSNEVSLNNKTLSDRKNIVLSFLFKNYLFVSLFLLVVASSFLTDNFLTQQNLINILVQNSTIAIVSFGMLYVIITGGIDLSVGSMVALAVCLTAGLLNSGMPIFLAVLIVIVILVLVGTVSGTLVTVGKIEPFIATLAMMTIVRGIAYMYQVGSVNVISNETFLSAFGGNIGPIPIPVLYMVGTAFLLHFVLKNTTFGRKVYAIGGSKEAARLVGISVRNNLIMVYAISGLLAALAGIIMASRLRVGTALVGQGLELDAIAAVVIGGAAFSGGKGRILNTLIGAFIIGILGNIMNLMGVAAYPQMVIKGIIIVIAVLARRG